MATFLELTNLVLTKLNEVPLSSGDFTVARGPQANARNAVKQAVQDIVIDSIEWPFLYSSVTQALTPGQTTYALASATRKVDWDTIRLVKDANLGVEAKPLKYISYEDWVRARRERDENATSAEWRIPEYVFRNLDNSIGVSTKPDKAYSITYDRWVMPAEMVEPGDVCIIPDDYKNVVVDGATWHMYAYRSNDSFADKQEQRFMRGIARMRQVLIPNSQYVSTPFMASGGNSGRYRMEGSW